MTVAVIVDMPTDYHKQQKLGPEYPSMALADKAYRGKTAKCMEHKLAGVPSEVLVAAMVPESAKGPVEEYLKHHNYFGRDPRTVRLYPARKCYAFDPNTADFVLRADGKEAFIQEGSLSALRGFFESGVAEEFRRMGGLSGHLHISFMENPGATVDPAALSMLHLSGKGLLAEITEWHGEDGPLAIKTKSTGLALLERENIDDAVYYLLQGNLLQGRRELVGGVGTGTYIVDIEKFLGAIGVAAHPASDILPSGSVGLGLRKVVEPHMLVLRREVEGAGEAVYIDARLSILTRFLDTLFVEVPRERKCSVS